MASTSSTAGVGADQPAEGGDVVADAGRGFAERAADGDGVGMLGQRLGELLRPHRLALRGGDADRLGAEGLARCCASVRRSGRR